MTRGLKPLTGTIGAHTQLLRTGQIFRQAIDPILRFQRVWCLPEAQRGPLKAEGGRKKGKRLLLVDGHFSIPVHPIKILGCNHYRMRLYLQGFLPLRSRKHAMPCTKCDLFATHGCAMYSYGAVDVHSQFTSLHKMRRSPSLVFLFILFFIYFFHFLNTIKF